MRVIAMLLAAAALFAGTHSSHAQTSSSPIRLLVGVAAGASTDLVARLVADKLQGLLGDTVIVDNKPGAGQGITFGSPGAGSTSHFAGLMFAKAANLQMTHTAYRGGAPALNDLMGGHIALVTTAASDLPPLAKAGKLAIIATAGHQRSHSAP